MDLVDIINLIKIIYIDNRARKEFKKNPDVLIIAWTIIPKNLIDKIRTKIELQYEKKSKYKVN